MDAPKILHVLQNAHLAHKAGDFTNALKFYEQFFDGALLEEPEALYGIRLNHCLDGWSRLADSFPGARKRLVEKQVEVLEVYNENKNPERFHDYIQISRRLGEEKQMVDTFVGLHQRSPKSAAKLIKFVWDDLVADEQWKICNTLLEQPSMKLDELFAVFDEASQLKEVDPSFDSIEFEQHTVEQLITNLQAVVVVLRNGDRTPDIKALERQFFQGIQSRDNSTLNKRINAQGSFLFAAH